jgi:tRNA threonylcarbamoyladenosine biosynthesis protein TsaE
MKQEDYVSHSATETTSLGYRLGSQLPLGSVVCFQGELGAGKTTFIKGLTAGATGLDPHFVQSPTFTYLNIYQGIKTIYHFDLYRLKGVNDFLNMGFDEYLEAPDGICCIEWSERISSYLPTSSIYISLTHRSPEERLIKIIYPN